VTAETYGINCRERYHNAPAAGVAMETDAALGLYLSLYSDL